jgi:hypothetical protein
MKLIETKTLGSNAASVIFTSIPQDGTDLLVKFSARTNVSDVIDTCLVDFNTITTGFTNRTLLGFPDPVTSQIYNEARRAGHATGANQTSNTFATVELYIPNYAGSTNKSVSVESATEGTSTYYEMLLGATLWSNTAAITSLTLRPFGSSLFVTGSIFSLYKITKGSSGGVVVS